MRGAGQRVDAEQVRALDILRKSDRLNDSAVVRYNADLVGRQPMARRVITVAEHQYCRWLATTSTN